MFLVSSREETSVDLTIPEEGVRGIQNRTDNPAVVQEITAYANGIGFRLRGRSVIKDVQKVSMGDRLCIDTIPDMKQAMAC